MAAPPDPQPVQRLAQQTLPLLGYIQACQGYLKRRTNILKRWKKQWFGIAPGEFHLNLYIHTVVGGTTRLLSGNAE